MIALLLTNAAVVSADRGDAQYQVKLPYHNAPSSILIA
jgi:hypothetical protein